MEISGLVKEYRLGIDTHLAVHWMEVKNKKSGRTSTPQNIENAFRQVLMGVGGFGQEQREQRKKRRESFKVSFIPVVMTTAQLHVARYDIEDVDPGTGTIHDKEKVSFTPVDWVLVNYSVNNVLLPEVIPETYPGTDPGAIQKLYKQRSVFVVNSKCIKSFLSKLDLKKLHL